MSTQNGKRDYDAEVFEAANALHEAGEDVTNEKVRDWLGKHGKGTISFSYSVPALKKWRAEERSGLRVVKTDNLPDEVRMALQQATAILWKSATLAAEERIGKIEEDAKQKIAQSNSDSEEMKTEILRIEDLLIKASEREKEAADRIEGLLKDLSAKDGAAKVNEERIREQKETIELLTRKLDGAEKKLLRLDELEVKVIPSLTERAGKAEAEAKERAEVLKSGEQQRERLQEQIRDLQKDLKEHQKELAEERQSVSRLSNEAVKAESARKDLQNALDIQRQRVSQLEGEAVKFESARKKLQDELDEERKKAKSEAKQGKS